MKETVSFSLSAYEYLSGALDIECIENKVLKFFIALCMLPLFLSFIALALFIEEPLKCLFFLITFQTNLSKVWKHYKKCWRALLGGMRQW